MEPGNPIPHVKGIQGKLKMGATLVRDQMGDQGTELLRQQVEVVERLPTAFLEKWVRN